jgi:hypothetical protein
VRCTIILSFITCIVYILYILEHKWAKDSLISLTSPGFSIPYTTTWCSHPLRDNYIGISTCLNTDFSKGSMYDMMDVINNNTRDEEGWIVGWLAGWSVGWLVGGWVDGRCSGAAQRYSGTAVQRCCGTAVLQRCSGAAVVQQCIWGRAGQARPGGYCMCGEWHTVFVHRLLIEWPGITLIYRGSWATLCLSPSLCVCVSVCLSSNPNPI